MQKGRVLRPKSSTWAVYNNAKHRCPVSPIVKIIWVRHRIAFKCCQLTNVFGHFFPLVLWSIHQRLFAVVVQEVSVPIFPSHKLWVDWEKALNAHGRSSPYSTVNNSRPISKLPSSVLDSNFNLASRCSILRSILPVSGSK